MFRQLIEKVSQADIYMISSFLIFFIFFIAVTVMLVKTSKDEVQERSIIPLKPDHLDKMEDEQ